MCNWGTEAILPVTVPAHLSHTGEARVAEKGIDACIALADGRRLMVYPADCRCEHHPCEHATRK